MNVLIMRQIALLISILCSVLKGISLHAQPLTQTIRGVVVDATNREPLIGAEVYVMGIDPIIGTVSDAEGKFVLEQVPVGRRTVVCRYTGYSSFERDNILLNSAKEFFIEMALSPGVEMGEVVVTDTKRSYQAVNQLAVASTRRLEPEELQYHAATANDPGRLVMGFPGVQPARDNSNDIVIRGNATQGLLWRLEGIDIPNPNHFATRGGSGGGITIFSATMLGSSDFSMGAFPAEYGNAFSGVFDMQFRNGNLYTREHTLRAGILGLDIATEGPIQKGKSSYLANFRYSTLGILNAMGVYLVGPRTGNNFQDFSFKIFHKGKKSQFSLWGIGGNSVESFRPADSPRTTFSDHSQYNFTTRMGVVGASYNYLINDQAYIRLNLAYMGQNQHMVKDTLNSTETAANYEEEKINNSRLSLSGFYKWSPGAKTSFKLGFLATRLWFDLNSRELNFNTHTFFEAIKGTGSSFLWQPYAQLSYHPHPRLMLNLGVHGMALSMNESKAIDPRFSMKYRFTDQTDVALAWGRQSTMQTPGIYFTSVDGIDFPNRSLPLIHSDQWVLALTHLFKNGLRIQMEGYHQNLSNVPVNTDQNQIFWALNTFEGFTNKTLRPDGLGRNYGIDAVIEKTFQSGSFFILSGSVYSSTFQTEKGGIVYNTRYNGRYALTFSGGKNWQLNRTTSLEMGFRTIYNAGMPITPLLPGSEAIDGKEALLDHSRPMTDRISFYLRPDLRLALRKNKAGSSWWLALDIQNVINRKNDDYIAYEFKKESLRWAYRSQSTLTPILTFQLDF
ncbi:MAG: carboxypeptidase-like regulatory domain-containing protein [Saprospiraceae bacterium]|nr:carboxypeptidase-like regulatory domain-containing protein [Saprospiraceae bacterium]